MDRQDARQRLTGAYPVMRRFAAVVGPPDVEPDDLVQDAFVAALAHGLDDIDDLLAYLRRTIVNLSASSRRTWVRRQAVLSRLGPLPVAEEMEVPLVSEIQRLPVALRAALWLADVEGWTFAEIGQILGCSEDAARTRASRARRRLRLELAQEAGR